MNRNFYLLGRRNALNFSLFSFCCFFSLFLALPTAYAQLSGTYTIGGADGTYANFTEAASALQAQGVSGPVTFKVRPSTYKEQLSLTAFAGNSCENPVVFEGEGVAPGQVILQGPEGTSNTVELNGPDGIGFRNMSFTGPGKVFVTNPGTNCFSLENTIIKSLGGILVHALSGSEAGGDHHIYRNNTFQGGVTGILKENVATWNPQAPKFDDGLIIEGNQFRGQGNAAMDISGQQGFTISNNLSEGGGSGILLSNSWYGKEISGNNINANVGNYKGVGISLNSAAAERITENYIRLQEGGFGMDITTGKTSGNEILLANNIIEVNGYDARGHNYFPISNLVGLDIINNYPNKLKIYHNTVRVAGYSEDVPNISFSAGGESNSFYIKNNSFANHSNGTVMVIGSLAAIAEMDYNNINGDYAKTFARLGGKEINGLAAWQSATGFDTHSVSVNPGPPEDPVEALTGAGIYLEEVPKDIFKVTRNNPPAIGAVEDGDSKPALAGVYTIGGGNSDYSTFTAAISALRTYGIRESVIFKVQPGEYHEQLNISELRNQDLQITFEGATNDSTEVVLIYPLDDGLVIRDSKNITFRNMTLSSGVNLSNSSGLLFERNVIVGGVNAHSVGGDVYRNNLFKDKGINKTSKGYNQTHGRLYKDGPVNIEGNSFEVFGSAISLFAQTGVKINNNQIRIGEAGIVNQHEAIEVSSGSTDEINNNTIVSYLPGATGINIAGAAYRGELPKEIMNNKISLMDGGTGIDIGFGATGSSLVANNLISIKADDSSRGIAVFSSGAGIDFFFNSVYLYGDGTDSKVFYFEVDYEEPLNVHFKNNIFANLAGGYVLYEELYDNIKRLASSDYNDLYTSGETFAMWDGQAIPDLSSWQALTGFDAHSLSVNPQFKSAENPEPENPALKGAGISIPAVDVDFYGKQRNSPPSIGAIEAEDQQAAGPVAKAGKDRTISLPVEKNSLSGTAQVSDARIVAYRWEKISGPSVTMSNQNTANVNLSDLTEGEYVFRFSATDSKGRTGSDEMMLTVEEGDGANLAPEAKAGKDKTITLPDNSIILSGLAYTSEGRFVAFRWEKISGPSVTMTGDRTANVKLSDLKEGEYVFRFSATNDRGLTGTDEMTLTVLPAVNTNQPPVVNAGKDVTITTAYGQYFLSGTGHDPDGRFTAFRWEKVSGPAVTLSGQNTANLKITDFEAGEYVFRFSATDNGGATASDEVMVTVKEAENAAPSLVASTSVTAYPNTFQSYINLEIEAEEPEEYQIMVYDMLGKIFYTNSFVPDNFNNATHTIDFSGQVLREGAYYIRIENQEGSFRKMLKVVKTN